MDDSQFIEIQRLFELVHRRGLRDLSVSRPGFAIEISTVPTHPVTAPTHGPHVSETPALHLLPAVAARPAPASETPAKPTGYEVTSPLVGTFYRSPSPDAPSFIEVGDHVEEGQTLCIVEAMKVFNEITAERAGKVLAIPATNGKLVRVGDVLAVLDTE